MKTVGAIHGFSGRLKRSQKGHSTFRGFEIFTFGSYQKKKNIHTKNHGIFMTQSDLWFTNNFKSNLNNFVTTV